ncbi:MAG: DUF4465 domain-containing protein [Spirochaetes bacterium]|nr:DUF4465 domain-containing protein [Spirochaetota bacterium]
MKQKVFKNLICLFFLFILGCSVPNPKDSPENDDTDTTKPTISISSPADGAILTNAIIIQVAASDNVSVAKVEFYNGSTLISTETEAPYSSLWNLTAADNGSHTLKAVATDTANNTSETSINVTVAVAIPYISTFDDHPLSPDSYWGGAGSDETAFTSGVVTYYHTSDAFSWSGFLYSNMTDTTTAGFTNQYSAYTIDASNGNPGGYNGSANYSISYVALDWLGGTYDPIPNTIMVTRGDSSGFAGFYITNTTYAYLSMLNGDGFAKKFGGTDGNDEDWFLLTIKGLDADGDATGTIEFYLADFRFSDNSNDYIIDEWTWVDLTSLGNAVLLEFSLTSSDTGTYGMNTPGYFAIDHLTVTE